jgi:hypothetical protein
MPGPLAAVAWDVWGISTLWRCTANQYMPPTSSNMAIESSKSGAPPMNGQLAMAGKADPRDGLAYGRNQAKLISAASPS